MCLHRAKINLTGKNNEKEKIDPLHYNQSEKCLKNSFSTFGTVWTFLQNTPKALTRYWLNHRKRFMYLQTLGFLMNQAFEIPEQNVCILFSAKLSNSTFCNGSHVSDLCHPVESALAWVALMYLKCDYSAEQNILLYFALTNLNSYQCTWLLH